MVDEPQGPPNLATRAERRPPTNSTSPPPPEPAKTRQANPLANAHPGDMRRHHLINPDTPVPRSLKTDFFNTIGAQPTSTERRLNDRYANSYRTFAEQLLRKPYSIWGNR